MSRIGIAKDQIMSWIEANYYLEIKVLLDQEGYTCEPKDEAPWYTTNCPRSKAMGLHNQALTTLLDRLKRNRSMGFMSRKLLIGTLKQKFFSDEEIQKQVAFEAVKA